MEVRHMAFGVRPWGGALKIPNTFLKVEVQ